MNESNKENVGIKHDKGKLPWHLLPWEPVEEVVKVLQFGAEKYKANNWQKLDEFDDRYFSAAMRHLVAHQKGEVVDPESDLPHLAHAMCCIMFLLWGELKHNEVLSFPMELLHYEQLSKSP